MREITCINFMITTECNRRCPDCCCNIPYKKERQHFDWDYIQESAKYMQNLDRIQLTGGEPTMHPDFLKIVPRLKDLFNCKNLTIETNGWGFHIFPEVFKFFDWIQVTHYTSKTYLGCDDNTDDIKFLQNYLKNYPVEIKIAEVVHIQRNGIKRGSICARGTSETVSYENGLIYPCCVGNGVTGAVGIPLDYHWKDMIEYGAVPLPCKNCWFSC